jgi:hypothetical protein
VAFDIVPIVDMRVDRTAEIFERPQQAKEVRGSAQGEPRGIYVNPHLLDTDVMNTLKRNDVQ